MKAGRFISNFLKAEDVTEPQHLTIRTVKSEKVGMGDDQETKAVIYFIELEQGLVLNKTNLKKLVALFGDEMDNWTGKKITLASKPTQFSGEEVMGLRVGSADA